MGIPTVVDGETLAFDLLYRPEGTSEESMEQLRQMFQPQGRSMMVTPREVDQMVERGAKLISMAINLALQPDLSAEEITYLLGLTGWPAPTPLGEKIPRQGLVISAG